MESFCRAANSSNGIGISVSNEKHGGYLESIREAALSIYQENLSDKASPRINIEDSLNKKLMLVGKSKLGFLCPGW